MRQGWEIKKLEGLCELITKGTTPTSIGHKFVPEGINFVKVESISLNGEFILEKFAHITEEGNVALKRSQLKADDILFSIAGALGRTAIVSENILPANTNQALAIIRLKDDSSISKEYILSALTSGFTLEQVERLKGGVAQQNLSLTQIKSFEIPLPPLPEQKRIVAILDKAFAAIAKAKANAEQNLKNAKELFESYLQGVFENKGEGWEEKTIEKVCAEIFAGGDAPKGNFSKEKNEKYEIPIFANAVKNNGLYGFTNFARVNKPSITIAARGSGTGHTEIRYEQFLPIVRLIVLIPNLSLVTLEFLKHSIDNLEILRSGSAIPQLTVPMMKKYKIPFPPLKKQQTIVKKLDALSGETKKLEAIYQQKIDNLEELKMSILQKAFNGELT